MKKYCVVLLVCFISLCYLLSCGLEALYYIDYIPNSVLVGTTRATITLPSGSDEGYSTYFTHFIIFYRIYISDMLEEGRIAETATNDVNQRLLNSYLNSDFAYLYPSTDKTSTTVSTANLENMFFNRRYFLLNVQGIDINTVLSAGSLGKTLVIAFPPNTGVEPTLTLDGTPYTLQRNKDLLQPKPNRRFLNHPDLYDTANIIPERNIDVAANTNPAIQYTYVSMYIAAKGKSFELPPQDVYSQPTFIGVFRLADSS